MASARKSASKAVTTPDMLKANFPQDVRHMRRRPQVRVFVRLNFNKLTTSLGRIMQSLSRHNNDVTEALNKIHLDETLSKQDMRNAIKTVLAMVCRLP
jgi:hypothetical protein